jgi:hypothetical protein
MIIYDEDYEIVHRRVIDKDETLALRAHPTETREFC